MVFVKIFKLSLSLFFFKIGRNIVFEFVVKKKQPFLDHKNEIFSKGLTHGVGENFQNIFSVCFSLKKA